MAQEENSEPSKPELPTGRVKRIVKLDREINKVSSEALFLISRSTELFLRFLAERSAGVAVEKKRKTVKLEHLRAAFKGHRPTSDFLLDCLPLLAPPAAGDTAGEKTRSRAENDKQLSSGTRRIDQFFTKPANGNQVQLIDS